MATMSRCLRTPFITIHFHAGGGGGISSLLFIVGCLLALGLVVPPSHAAINGTTNLCSLLVLTPLTPSGHEQVSATKHQQQQIPFGDDGHVGFSHMAAALLAASHFNNRDASVVPELANLVLPFDDDNHNNNNDNGILSSFSSSLPCPYQFDMDLSRVVDSSHRSAEQHQHQEHEPSDATAELMEYILEVGKPCATVGPMSNMVARQTSVVTSAAQIPSVLYAATDVTLALDQYHPWVSQTNPLSVDLAGPLVKYLHDELHRADYVAILYKIGDHVSTQHQEALSQELQGMGMQTVTAGFVDQGDGFVQGIDPQQHSIHAALDLLQEMGDYRTIVVVSDTLDASVALPALAEAADERNMNNGDYVWAFYGSLPLSTLDDPNVRNSTVIRKLLQGAVTIGYVDGFMVDGDEDRFLQTWKNQSVDMVDKLRQWNPMAEEDFGFFYPPDNYFQNYEPAPTAGFIYDAVMAVGIGSCLAYAARPSSNNTMTDLNEISSSEHMDWIRASQFHGATGHVEFGKTSFDNAFGVREYASAMIGAFNLYPDGNNTFALAGLIDPSNQSVTVIKDENEGAEWTTVVDFVFRDGTLRGPLSLKGEAEEHFLSSGVRIFGFALFFLASAACIAAIVWIVVCRNHPLFRAAQPVFLVGTCLGALIQACCIPLSSFDERSVQDTTVLSHLCVAVPWCLIVGGNLISGCLFAKLWRVQKVLTFARAKVDVKDVMTPVVAVFIVNVVLLAVWTALSDHGWYRIEIDEITGESVGRCSAGPDGIVPFLVASFAVGSILTFAAIFMAWKTKDVEDTFSESWWVFTLTIVQAQTRVIGIPLVFALRDTDANSRYLGQIIIFFWSSFSVVGLIMAPKVLAYWGIYGSNMARRGALTGTRVSGLQDSAIVSTDRTPNVPARLSQDPSHTSHASHPVSLTSSLNGRDPKMHESSEVDVQNI